MPDKTEIARRKEITKNLRLKAPQAFEAGLPMSRHDFNALFDHLDIQLTESLCDNSLKFSIEFLNSLNPGKLDTVIGWLRENGGYCDCEVLANVEDKFDDNAIL